MERSKWTSRTNICVCVCVCVYAKSLQSDLTLRLHDCSPPHSSVHGILQARIQEWVATPFFRESFWPRDQTPVSCIAGRFFTVWATREFCAKLPLSSIPFLCLPSSILLVNFYSFLKIQSKRHFLCEPCLIPIGRIHFFCLVVPYHWEHSSI